MERFETKYDLLNRVYADTRLKRTTKSLMQYLVAKSDDRSCHPSVAVIAAAIRMSERTVQRHIRELEKYRYLVCRSRFYRNEQLTNQYEFVLDVVDESDGEKHPGAGFDIDIFKEMQEKNQNFIKMKYLKYLSGTRLSNKECLVLIYFVHKADRDGIAYNNIKKISKELHLSVRLLWKILLELRKKQYLLIKSNAGKLIVKLTEPDVEGRLYPESKHVCPEYVTEEAESSARVNRKNRICFPYPGKKYKHNGWHISREVKLPKGERIQRIFKHCFSTAFLHVKKILRHFLS